MYLFCHKKNKLKTYANECVEYYKRLFKKVPFHVGFMHCHFQSEHSLFKGKVWTSSSHIYCCTLYISDVLCCHAMANILPYCMFLINVIKHTNTSQDQTLYPSLGKNESSSSSERYLFLSSISLSQRYACICSGVMAMCPGVGVCICIAAGPAGVTPLVPIIGVVPPIWLAGVSSHLDRRLLPGVGVAPGVSAPVRSVLGVSAQPGVACPGVSPFKQSVIRWLTLWYWVRLSCSDDL